MTFHLFGAVSSPSCATFAEDNQNDYPPEVTDTIRSNFYVDDCLKAMGTEEQAMPLYRGLTEVCAKGRFKLTKWVSNHCTVLSLIAEEKKASEVKTLWTWIENTFLWSELLELNGMLSMTLLHSAWRSSSSQQQDMAYSQLSTLCMTRRGSLHPSYLLASGFCKNCAKSSLDGMRRSQRSSLNSGSSGWLNCSSWMTFVSTDVSHQATSALSWQNAEGRATV